MDHIKQTGIGLIGMVLGIIMSVVPFIVIPFNAYNTISEILIHIFVPMIGLLFFIFSLPIIARSKKKNLKT